MIQRISISDLKTKQNIQRPNDNNNNTALDIVINLGIAVRK